MNSMTGNFNLQPSAANQYNTAAPVHWPANTQSQSKMFKMQQGNISESGFHVQQANHAEMSPHTRTITPQGTMMTHGNMMTSQTQHTTHGNIMTSHNHMITAHGGIAASQGNVMTSQGNIMTSPVSNVATQGNAMTSQSSMMMSPAGHGHQHFPFSFSTSKQPVGGLGDMRPDKMQQMGPNMTMDSPLLVNLLQNEASGMNSPTQFASATPPSSNQKPKRKKPQRKKKPAKSAAPSTPTGTAPMQAFGGMYSMQGPPQHYPGGEMQSPPDQIMPPQQGGMANTPDSKFIDAISRSDVGAQSAGFTNDSIISSEVATFHPSNQQMPVLRRHNSFPVSRSASFPHGFDPSKPAPYPHRPHLTMSPQQQQQQMYMQQMAGPYSQYKSGHPPRQVLMQSQQGMQQQGDNSIMQQHPTNFQPGMSPMSMMQQNSSRPQRFSSHPPTPPQMQNQGKYNLNFQLVCSMYL